MARCHVCDATDTPMVQGLTPWRHSRQFRDDPNHPHLDICSSCETSIYSDDGADWDNELGEVANLIPSESYMVHD